MHCIYMVELSSEAWSDNLRSIIGIRYQIEIQDLLNFV